MGNWLDSLDVINDNFPVVWDIFKDTFATRFQDSLKPQNAQSELSKLKMDFPHIDQYVARFEDLARLAGYTVGNSETINIFLRGLDPDVLRTVLLSENVDTYDQIRQHAISATRSKQLIVAIQGRGAQSNNNAFQHFQGQRRPYRPFFQHGNQGNPQQQQRRPHYNSTNAPHWMNNTPVPMDLSRARAPTRYQTRGNAAQTGGLKPPQRTKGPCFNCSKMGHFTCECFTKQTPQHIQHADVMDQPDVPLDYPIINADNAIAYFDTLSDKDTQNVIDTMGAHMEQSFPSA
jgi:hypothetical protein